MSVSDLHYTVWCDGLHSLSLYHQAKVVKKGDTA